MFENLKSYIFTSGCRNWAILTSKSDSSCPNLYYDNWKRLDSGFSSISQLVFFYWFMGLHRFWLLESQPDNKQWKNQGKQKIKENLVFPMFSSIFLSFFVGGLHDRRIILRDFPKETFHTQMEIVMHLILVHKICFLVITRNHGISEGCH